MCVRFVCMIFVCFLGFSFASLKSSADSSNALDLVVDSNENVNVDFSSDFSAKTSEDFYANSSENSKVFALSKFDKKMLENGTFKGYVMSEKLDGVRAIWDGINLKSRSGRIFSAPKCWLDKLPPFGLDGELFIDRGRFEEVLSVVSRGENECEQCKCEEWQKVGYFIFDVPNCDDFLNMDLTKIDSSKIKSCTLLERLAVLEKWLEKNEYLEKNASIDFASKSMLHIIPQIPINSQKELDSKLKEVIKSGGEGIVIRKNSAPYERFRTPNAMKLKGYEDAECVVIAHNIGKGKYANALGSITCESLELPKSNLSKSTLQTNTPATKKSLNPATNPKTSIDKIRFKIGSGFSDKMRANPPPLGTIITYKYYGITKNGLPRFPIFLRIYSPQ